MEFPRYRLEVATLPRTPLGRLGTDEVAKLVGSILTAWHPAGETGASFPSDYVDLNVDISRRTEGASDAEVYDLALSPRGGKTIARFIIKAHFGADATGKADRERESFSIVSRQPAQSGFRRKS